MSEVVKLACVFILLPLEEAGGGRLIKLWRNFLFSEPVDVSSGVIGVCEIDRKFAVSTPGTSFV